MAFIQALVALILALAALTPQETQVVPPLPVPSATPAVATVGPVSSVESIICSFDWPCGEALLVVYGPTPPNAQAPYGCPNGESGGDPLAIHDGGDGRGLFAINGRWHRVRFERRGWTWADAFDAYKNAAIAHELWSETRDWRAWSCRP